MVEILIVALVSAPVLLAIVSTSERVGRTVSTSDRAAEASESNRKLAERLDRFFRTAEWSTFRVRATYDDVTNAKATTVGEWIQAEEVDPRDNLRFQSKSGKLSMNASALTTVRELEFVRDAGEMENGVDDDGDGYVDEGVLMMRYETVRSAIARNVEHCSFELDGEIVRFKLTSARKDRDGGVHRESTSRVIWVRNR